MHQHPELHGVIARGEIHVTGLSMNAPFLGGPRHTEAIERARFRAKREIARLIAEIDPKPRGPRPRRPRRPRAPSRVSARDRERLRRTRAQSARRRSTGGLDRPGTEDRSSPPAKSTSTCSRRPSTCSGSRSARRACPSCSSEPSASSWSGYAAAAPEPRTRCADAGRPPRPRRAPTPSPASTPSLTAPARVHAKLAAPARVHAESSSRRPGDPKAHHQHHQGPLPKRALPSRHQPRRRGRTGAT